MGHWKRKVARPNKENGGATEARLRHSFIHLPKILGTPLQRVANAYSSCYCVFVRLDAQIALVKLLENIAAVKGHPFNVKRLRDFKTFPERSRLRSRWSRPR